VSTTRALEKQEIHHLFACIEGTFALRNQTMLVCGIAMALRATELVSLNVGDVLASNGEVKTYVTIRPETAKFSKERTIRIGEKVKRAIAGFMAHKGDTGESLAPDAPLFVSRQGGHRTRQTLFLWMKKIFEAAGLEESPHCLRKTGATAYYLQSNYDLLATQEFLGHADPSTTRRYIGLDTEQLIEYSEKLSEFLFDSIRGEFNTSSQMLNSFSDSDLFMELHERGYDVGALSQQRHQKTKTATKVVSINALRRVK